MRAGASASTCQAAEQGHAEAQWRLENGEDWVDVQPPRRVLTHGRLEPALPREQSRGQRMTRHKALMED